MEIQQERHNEQTRVYFELLGCEGAGHGGGCNFCKLRGCEVMVGGGSADVGARGEWTAHGVPADFVASGIVVGGVSADCLAVRGVRFSGGRTVRRFHGCEGVCLWWMERPQASWL